MANASCRGPVCPRDATQTVVVLDADDSISNDKTRKGSKVANLVCAINAKVQEQSSPTRCRQNITFKRTSSTGRSVPHLVEVGIAARINSFDCLLSDKCHSQTLKPRAVYEVPNGFGSEYSYDGLEVEPTVRQVTRSLGRNEYLCFKEASHKSLGSSSSPKTLIGASDSSSITPLQGTPFYHEELRCSPSSGSSTSTLKEIPKGKVESNPFFQQDRQRTAMQNTVSPTRVPEESITSKGSPNTNNVSLHDSRNSSLNMPMSIKMKIQLWSGKEKLANHQEVLIERRKSAHFPVTSSPTSSVYPHHADCSSCLTNTCRIVSNKQRSNSMSSLHTSTQKKNVPAKNISIDTAASDFPKTKEVPSIVKNETQLLIDHTGSSVEVSRKGSPKRNRNESSMSSSKGSFSKLGARLLSPRFRRKKHNSSSQEYEDMNIKIADRYSKKRKAFRSKVTTESNSSDRVNNFGNIDDEVFIPPEEDSSQKDGLSSITLTNKSWIQSSPPEGESLYMKKRSENKLALNHQQQDENYITSNNVCDLNNSLRSASKSEIMMSSPCGSAEGSCESSSDDESTCKYSVQRCLDKKVSPSISVLKRRASDNVKPFLTSEIASIQLVSEQEDVISSYCGHDKIVCFVDLDEVYKQEAKKVQPSIDVKPKTIVTNADSVINMRPEMYSSSELSVSCFDQSSKTVCSEGCYNDGDAVMSIFDLDQYDIMLQSLINELSTLSEELGSDGLIATSLMCADAVWDRDAQDSDELSFKVGDVIEILDMTDDVWWQGSVQDAVGWFPASFVRLRIGQEPDCDETETGEAISPTEEDTSRSSGTACNVHRPSDSTAECSPEIDTYTGSLPRSQGNSVRRRMTIRRKDSTTSLPHKLTPTEVRAKVVEEILSTERDYVHNLEDIIEGFLNRCRDYSTLFDADKVETIFSNVEQIYKFQRDFLRELELKVDRDRMDCSEIGDVFVINKHEFAVYSQYCNNHPHAVNEMNILQQNEQYTLFFESCRLLRNLQNISLEGFLLTPVQKICKYPLQLSELLKYTDKSHPDYDQVVAAQQAMKEVAMQINEQKRRMESIGKIGLWQMSIDGWKGQDILEKSTELIYSGELHKISKGHSQERHFFLFDRQLVYCKKEIGGRLSYKGRLYMEECQIADIPDGNALHGNTPLKNAWRMNNKSKEKWYIIYAKSPDIKKEWMDAFQHERMRVHEDFDKGFHISMKMKRAAVSLVENNTENIKRRKSFSRKHILFTESVDTGVRHRIDSSSSTKKLAISANISSPQPNKKHKGNKKKS